jgi:hypothetical protein
MTQEALKLALAALEINLTLLEKITPYKGQEDFLSDAIVITQDTITAIKEALANHVEGKLTMVAQPEQVREAYASITIRVGNRYIQQFVTQEMFLNVDDPWWLLDQYARQCVEKLKESA